MIPRFATFVWLFTISKYFSFVFFFYSDIKVEEKFVVDSEMKRKISVGVGGAVLREKNNDLLVIKERVRNLEFWKVKT